MGPITRAFDAKTEVFEGERSVVAKVNTDCVDRFGTCICPDGARLDAFRKNPVVLVNHGQSHDGLPVGRCAWIKYSKADRAIISKTIFDDDEDSDAIFKKYQCGTMRAFSVRVLPEAAECSAPTAQELRKRPELAECWMMVRAWELAEYSVVSVPGNSEALALAVSRGLMLPDSLIPNPGLTKADPEPLAVELPPLVGRSFGDVHAALTRRLRELLPAAGDARQAAQDAVDLLRGKI